MAAAFGGSGRAKQHAGERRLVAKQAHDQVAHARLGVALEHRKQPVERRAEGRGVGRHAALTRRGRHREAVNEVDEDAERTRAHVVVVAVLGVAAVEAPVDARLVLPDQLRVLIEAARVHHMAHLLQAPQ